MAKKVNSKKGRPSGSKASRPAAAKPKKVPAKVAAKPKAKPQAKLQAKTKIESAPAFKPEKCPLTKSELAQFRQLLLDKRRAILGDMGGISDSALRARQDASGDLSNMPTHPADIGTDNYEHEFSLGLLESERLLMAEINEALDRIDKGTYGICLGTGRFIGKPRLMARPWAKYHIEYARQIEKGLARPAQESRADEDEEADDVDHDEDEEDLLTDEEPVEGEPEGPQDDEE